MTFFASAQTCTVRGVVRDSSKQVLEFASIILLKAKDSTLLTFASSNADGVFELQDVPSGAYKIKVTYVGLDPLKKDIVIDATQKVTTLPDFILLPKGMNDILIRGYKDPIKVNKDTIEYNAKSFAVQPNAVVEDLLKKLPGVQVDKQGTVTANGEQVVNILVDGKPFFGKDPKMATKNLPADAIEKIQVFDKKSDQAMFSGIEDGDKEKTINLKLRTDKRQGSFGKVEAGVGTSNQANDVRYGAKGNYNRFSQKKQFAVLGMANNVGEQGFSYENYSNFTGDGLKAASGGGGSFSLNSDNTSLPLSFGEKTGFADTYAGGINFNNNFSEKTELNSNYSGSDIITNYIKSVKRNSFLGDKTIISNENSTQLNDNLNHRINVALDQKIDSSNSLKITTSYSIGQTLTKTNQLSDAMIDGATQNSNEGKRESVSKSKANRLNGELLWRHKFKKVGRTFSINLKIADNTNDGDVTLNARNGLLNKATKTLDFTDINQQQKLLQEGKELGANMIFTEKLARKKYIEFSYRFNFSENHSDKKVYDVFSNDLKINSLLTNEYRTTYVYNRPGVSLRLNNTDHKFTISAQMQQSQLLGNLITRDTTIRTKNLFFLPSVRYRYEISQSKNLTADYETAANQPSVTQLQPVADNSDPLNTYIGNPKLIPEYKHTLRVRFSSFNSTTFRNLFLNGSINYTQNKIVNGQTIGQDLRRISMPVNVDHDLSANLRANYGMQFIPQVWRANFGAGTRYSNGQNIINNALNLTKTFESSIRASTNYDLENKLQAGVSVDLVNTKSIYSLQNRLNQNYWTNEYGLDLTGFLPKGFSLTTNVNYTVYNGRNDGFNTNITIWNAALVKQLFKNKKGEIRLSVFDILNQNRSIRRTTQLNYVQDERVNALGRYWQLQFSYQLNQSPMSGGRGRGNRTMMMRG